CARDLGVLVLTAPIDYW
nr:immunoglobulin heavy chain junction region [Macaca mulatta]MPN71756.1 immunoglobulin heavy chain junction region [Macaca mulatta]MPN72136.1 immunoglobulin heavy chain junction region [Macaca mulatta]MPN72329.1 immunoglobulin heavy chain junction region [Macaca mulatta]MPN72444.1 immunoglobulin heavy chain junction region [Macaca mulatta]